MSNIYELDKEALEEDVILEEVENCPLCDNDKSAFLFWNYDRRYITPERFGTLQCTNCNLIRISPRPTSASIGRYYPKSYGAYKTAPVLVKNTSKHPLSKLRDAIRNSVLAKLGYDTGELSNWQKTLSPVLTRLFYQNATYGLGDLLPKYVPNASALEVGCGNGAYLQYLKHLGWKVTGADLSPHAVKSAKEQFGIDVFLGHLEDVPFPDESFDYIHLSHVVEHFFDPVKTMKKVQSLLKPGGVVFVEVPNAESISAKMSGSYWEGWDAPRHLFMFTPETLRKTLETAELKVIKMRTVMWNSFDWASTYRHEEKTAEKLAVRPVILPHDRLKVRLQSASAKIAYRLKPMQGDYLRCWAYRE